MTEALWRREFGADPNLVGRNIRIDSRQVAVVGVIPSSVATVAAQVEMFRPLAIDNTAAHDHVSRQTFVLARLRDGVPVSAALVAKASAREASRKQPPGLRTWPGRLYRSQR